MARLHRATTRRGRRPANLHVRPSQRSRHHVPSAGPAECRTAFTAEHGPNHTDEVTPLVAGGNAGWDPQNRPGLTCPSNYCGYAGNPTTMPMTDTARFPNAMRPSWVHNSGARGVGPATFLDGNQWKGWNGRLLVASWPRSGSLCCNSTLPEWRLECHGRPARSEEPIARTGARRESLCRDRRRGDLARGAELTTGTQRESH